MLSRNLVKFTSPARNLFSKHFSTCPKCRTSRLCIYSTSRYDALPALTQNHQVKFYSTIKSKPNFKDVRGSKKEENKIVGAAKPMDSATKPLNVEELLEKHIAGLSTDIYTKHRVYKNDFQRVLAKVKEFNYSTKKQGLLLLRCCTDLMPDEPPASRMAMAEQVWETLKQHTTLEVEHYNELLRVYIANKKTVLPSVFIQNMLPCKPEMTTYELLLRCLSEAGDLDHATEVVANIKSMNLPATESMFNSLIICQGKAGNLQNIQEVLTMMQSLKLERTAETHASIARALICNKQPEKAIDELTLALQKSIKFDEKQIMDIVKTLAEYRMYDFVPKVLRFLPVETLESPSISPYMQVVATQLVFQNQAMTALEIYNALPLPAFGPKDDQGLHGRSLVRDCVKANLPSSLIGLITQNLMASGRNPIALQNAAEAALQTGKAPLAVDMFRRMKQVGMPIRSHYFWPILLQSAKSYGEKGVINTLQTMVEMEVSPDYDTMMQYVLPHVSFTSPQNLIKKFMEAGLTATMVLTPIMVTLLKTGQVRAASEICELFKGKIDGEKLVKPLVNGYLISMDPVCTVHILDDMSLRAMDKNKDWVGRVLCEYLGGKNVKSNLNDFLFLLREMRKQNVKISPVAADVCLNRLPDNLPPAKLSELKELITKITSDQLVDVGEMMTQSMPHPKHMNEEGLRAHLNELEAKKLNTRGVLRKLLQEYCRNGNLVAAREIVDKCQQEGVFLSAGMKAAIFDLHVKMGELDHAELALADLNKTAPNFMLDEFKVIDFATLMVYRKKIDKAFELINEQSKRRAVKGGRSISMNCWRLLDAVAANNSHIETRNMFELLCQLNYCQPSNSLLGALIRVHLKVDNIDEAVKEFVRIGDKYKCTPLKHELLCHILHYMSDGLSEDNFLTNERCNGKLSKLARTVLNVVKKLHGASDVQLTVIAALADVGYKKSLRKVLLDPAIKVHPDGILRHCERFADAKKLHALKNIAECAKDLKHIDVADIYDLMLEVYQRDDEVKKAFDLLIEMQEQDVTPSQKFIKTVASMAQNNKVPVPPEIIALVDKEKKNVSN
ncbi:leucine-rich PPR motif-containing protein, mitochondrial [Phthorimaea operculella]|nr:leucine-rich PPR motif-containing protein, mitochondrial [Phthorimaea operculella]